MDTTVEPRSEFLLVAHRGGLFYRPENTMEAFRYSVEQGIRWVECDVRLSQDNVPVCVHDERLPLADGSFETVRDLSYRQIRTIDVGGGEIIPRLKDLFNNLGDRLRFFVEIKELDAVEKVIPLVIKLDINHRVIITSFIPEALQVARELAPDISRGLLIDRLVRRLVGGRNTIKAAEILECDYFLPHFHRLNGDRVKAAQSEGLKVVTWTVNHIEDARRMVDCGVDGIISDRPLFLQPIFNL